MEYIVFKRINNILNTMTEGKIHIKVGNLEIGYEGSEDYIKSDLLTMVEKVKDMFGIEEIPQVTPQTSVQFPQQPQIGTGEPLKLNPQTIAAKLNVKKGPQLAVAASAHLTFVEGCQEFTRKQILSTMKKAKGYYKDSFGSNLWQTLKNLVKSGKLNGVGTDTYSLPVDVREELKAQLA